MSPPILSVVGRSKEEKTRLVELLVRELKRRGCRVATVKHHIHGDFDIDRPGKSSHRHAVAGADAVVVSSPVRLALIERVEEEMPLSEIVSRFLSEVDLVLTEGYLKADTRKIEALGLDTSAGPLCEPDKLVFIVGDERIDTSVAQFGWDQAGEMVDLLEREGFCHAG